jgi:hypothetical protein
MSLADIGMEISELKRVTDATDKVILADRDFTALRLRASDYISEGNEEDRKKVHEYGLSTGTSLSDAIALIRNPAILALAQQVQKSFQDFASATDRLMDESASFVGIGRAAAGEVPQ